MACVLQIGAGGVGGVVAHKMALNRANSLLQGSSEATIKQSKSSLRGSKASEAIHKHCHSERSEASEESQQNRDISFSTKTQYDKVEAQYDSSIDWHESLRNSHNDNDTESSKNNGVFSRIILASRTLSKCKAIAESIRAKGLGEIEVDEVDADNVESVVALIEKYRPYLVVNVALPYQDLAIMEACLRTKTHYLDTANYEHPDSAHFEYKEQWAYDRRYKEAGIFALLGSGFDPGVTNVFCAYAQKHYFDEIHTIDILDCNAGDHGYAFATNFNPEINLREVSSKARFWIRDSAFSDFLGSASPTSLQRTGSASHSLTSHNPKHSSKILESQQSGGKDSRISSIANDLDKKLQDCNLTNSTTLQSNLALNPDLQEDRIYRKFEREEKHFGLESNTQDLQNQSYFGGQWRDVAPLALMKEWDYLGVGVKNSYLLYHEELESLIRNIKGLRKIRFFMTFGESYLTHMKCLENVGLLRIDEVSHKGGKIVPLEVLKTLLPDPASLAPRTKGQTHIGCYIKGLKDGKERIIYIYNICNHEDCYKEVGAQGVSYTTGVPAMIGAKLICEGKWGVGCEKNSPINSPINSPLGNHSADLGLCHEARTGSPLTSSQSPKNYESTSANAGILDSTSIVSERGSADSIPAFNADMPQGGEWQGIDNAVALQSQNKKSKNHIEVSLGDFSGFGVRSEGATKDVMAKAKCEQSLKNDKETTQGSGVWNMEQNDPDPFMKELNLQGLPYVVVEFDTNGKTKVLEDGRKKC